MTSEKQWYAIYTRPRCEKKVSQILSKKNIETYCALNRSVHQWADRKKTIHKPIFDSYVFVYIYESEHLRVKQTDGVLNFVYWLGKPAVIRDEEIEAIKNFLTEHDNVKLEKIAVNTSERINIVEEPLIYKQGTDLELNSQSVKLSLPSLGCAMIAEVRKNTVEIIQQYKALISKIA
ncbi:MAG: UpxY family transcription antiterminator [Chitinophagaceae bacterium]